MSIRVAPLTTGYPTAGLVVGVGAVALAFLRVRTSAATGGVLFDRGAPKYNELANIATELVPGTPVGSNGASCENKVVKSFDCVSTNEVDNERIGEVEKTVEQGDWSPRGSSWGSPQREKRHTERTRRNPTMRSVASAVAVAEKVAMYAPLAERWRRRRRRVRRHSTCTPTGNMAAGILRDARDVHEMRLLVRTFNEEEKGAEGQPRCSTAAATVAGAKAMLRANTFAKTRNLFRGFSECDHPILLARTMWVEATDQKHRYGSLLKFYYRQWWVVHM